MSLTLSPKDRVLSLLPKLSGKDLVTVKERLKSLNGLEIEDDGLTSDWVLAGIEDYLVRNGLRSHSGFLHKRKAYNTYLQRLPAVTLYLNGVEKQLHTVTRHRRRLGYICAEALAALLKSRYSNEVLSRVGLPALMLSQIDKLPEAIESAYPGYIAAGLFSFVVEVKNGNSTD